MATIRQGTRPENHFSLIPNALARHDHLTIQAKGLYLYLRSHSEGWSMSTDRIATALNIGRTSFWKYSNELITHGYLIRDQLKGDRGRFDANDYVVLSEPDWDQVEKPCERCSPCSQLPRTVITVNGESEQHKKTNSFKKKNDLRKPPIVPQGDERDFDAWYREYPKKVGRGQAVKAFRAAVKKADAETLIDAAKEYALTVQGKEKRFIKNPSTWLNGECWLDEMETPSFDDKADPFENLFQSTDKEPDRGREF